MSRIIDCFFSSGATSDSRVCTNNKIRNGRHKVTLGRVSGTIVAVDVQQCILFVCVAGLHDTAKYVKILSAEQPCFYGKVLSPATMKC